MLPVAKAHCSSGNVAVVAKNRMHQPWRHTDNIITAIVNLPQCGGLA